MMELLEALLGASISNILVVAGLIFILLALAGAITEHIKIPEERRRLVGILGFLFLFCGFSVRVIPFTMIAENWQNNSIANVANSFVEALVDGDCDRAEKYLTPSADISRYCGPSALHTVKSAKIDFAQKEPCTISNCSIIIFRGSFIEKYSYYTDEKESEYLTITLLMVYGSGEWRVDSLR